MRAITMLWLFVLLVFAIGGCSKTRSDAEGTAETTGSESALAADEQAEPPAADEASADAIDLGEIPAPIAAKDAKTVKLQVVSESGYVNERNQYVIDLLERDYAYLSARVETPEGRPVQGARVHFAVSGTSRVAGVDEVEAGIATDESGTAEFGVVGGAMGLDVIKLSVGESTADLVVNVISLKAAGYAALDEVEGALRWDDLMKARVRYEGEAMRVDFPAAVSAQSGKPVKLTGFMMPLEPQQKQTHFLLASNPPSCFFHVPGGPAGAVEVFAPKGIESSWDPLVLEGRFETVRRSEMGVIYRLRDARIVKP